MRPQAQRPEVPERRAERPDDPRELGGFELDIAFTGEIREIEETLGHGFGAGETHVRDLEVAVHDAAGEVVG